VIGTDVFLNPDPRNWHIFLWGLWNPVPLTSNAPVWQSARFWEARQLIRTEQPANRCKATHSHHPRPAGRTLVSVQTPFLAACELRSTRKHKMAGVWSCVRR
jgi:hypothetical protein